MKAKATRLGRLYVEAISPVIGLWRKSFPIHNPINRMDHWVKSRLRRGLPPILIGRRRFRPRVSIYVYDLREVNTGLVEELLRLVDPRARLVRWWIVDEKGRTIREEGRPLTEEEFEKLFDPREKILRLLKEGPLTRERLGRSIKLYGHDLDEVLRPLLEEGLVIEERRGRARLYRLLAP